MNEHVSGKARVTLHEEPSTLSSDIQNNTTSSVLFSAIANISYDRHACIHDMGNEREHWEHDKSCDPRHMTLFYFCSFQVPASSLHHKKVMRYVDR
jgi:hypothetical protein